MAGDWREQAASWADTVVRVLETPYPWASAHISAGPDDCDVTPERLHPVFHGSLDWHSSCHMQWSAVTLLGRARDALGEERAQRLSGVLDQRLTSENAEVERDYLWRRASYERPYGWGWLAVLAAASEASGNRAWAAATRRMADQVADNLRWWLPRLSYPVRHGVHSNTAFALGLCRDGFGALGREDVVALIDRQALIWFADDRDYPSNWEPSGNDFLSPALTEADLMRRVLPGAEFRPWLAGFLPRLGADDDAPLRTPRVRDRSDGQIVHLFGLGLSRAAMLRRIEPFVTDGGRRERIRMAASQQVAAASREVTSGDFMSTHWLVSFALLAELAAERDEQDTPARAAREDDETVLRLG